MTDNKPYYRDALLAFARMSGWIAGPILVALLLSKWLNFYVVISVAFAVSIFGIVREAKKWKP